MKLDKALNQLRDKLFGRIHSNYLIYNTCWEDPRIDRELLKFDSRSRVVMITSAGCNALDYLLDNLAEINCIDMNPRQNALLSLKQALIERASYPDLFQTFGKGFHPNIQELYKTKLRARLPGYAVEFWDKKLYYFADTRKRESFYYHGTSGRFAWLFMKYLRTQGNAYLVLEKLLEAQSLEEQKALYEQVEFKVMNRFVGWAMNRQLTLSLLGVPHSQRELIRTQYEGGMAEFIRDCLRHIFTELPIADNYFWRVYLTGAYTESCKPNYLAEENYADLQNRSSRIHLHCNTVSNFLREYPAKYTHYILLDHQDWMAAHAPEALKEEWELILKNSAKGAKILLRSAGSSVNFFPDFVLKAVEFEKENTARLHPTDRGGTYGRVYLATVK